MVHGPDCVSATAVGPRPHFSALSNLSVPVSVHRRRDLLPRSANHPLAASARRKSFRSYTQLELPVTALVAIIVASAVTWLVLLFMARVAKQKGGGGFARATMTSFMGLIVLAMGVQFALTGLRQFGL
jgi:hypothetical protein